ncbi:MAG: dephospho-CoA kinase [Deltaproteobacteria bacterium]|nr:dephospho-CoA kinase [Deltaproteobacteria bacterium]
MPLIGLTGGIATGKSLVTDYLRDKGILVVDADQLARKMVEPGRPAWEKIRREFGREYLRKDQTLDRRKLGDLVFATPEKRRALERIIHPEVLNAARKIIHPLLDADPDRWIIFSVPLLFESGFDKITDRVAVVYVDEATQLQRLIMRDGLTKADALKRIRAQMPIEEKKNLADDLIDNSGAPDETRRQVDGWLLRVRLSDKTSG